MHVIMLEEILKAFLSEVDSLYTATTTTTTTIFIETYIYTVRMLMQSL
jgi:hypothetical protein